MVYSIQNAAFRRDKQQFFSQIPTAGNVDSKIEVINGRVSTIDYAFLLKNHQALETEFTEMFSILQNQDDENKEKFWLYSYYCASLLESFYRDYSQQGKEAHYKNLKQQIRQRLDKVKVPCEPEQDFIQSLYHSFMDGFQSLIKTPFHLSKIRDQVAYANLCRIYWVFCRLTLTQGLTIAKELQIIDKLDVILGTHTDVDKIIATFQAPIGVINYFSVGFFLARFLIDGGLLIKHTFFPSELEKGAENGCEVTLMKDLPGAVSIDAYRNSYIVVQNKEESEIELYYIPKVGKAEKLTIREQNILKQALLAKMNKQQAVRLNAEEIKNLITAQTGHVPEVTTRLERFKNELYKRHCNFANDLVWATVNFLTNFNHITKISGPIAGYLTAVFLVFDICMTLYKCNLAKQEYLTKSAQYEEEIADYLNMEKFKHLSERERIAHIEMLTLQSKELEINWRTKEATFHFVAAAAALLMIGFTASLLVSPPLMVAACFFVCTVAVAMYLSSGAYAKYQEKSLYLEEAMKYGKNLPVALKEYEAARNDFIFTMVKNTVMPMILITTFAICWPAAIVLTAMYVGYELFHAYDQHKDAKAAKQLALPPATVEQGDESSEEQHLLPSPAFAY